MKDDFFGGLTFSEALLQSMEEVLEHVRGNKVLRTRTLKTPKYNEETRKVIDDALDGKDIHYVEDIEELKEKLEE